MAEEGFFEGTKKGTVLMKVSKDEKELFETFRNIKPHQWKELGGFVKEAKDIIQQGGLTSFFKAELLTVKDEMISMVLDPILAPILEALSPVIAEILEEIIPVIIELQPFLQGLGETLSEAIAVLKTISVQLPGGDEWDPFWSGTLNTLEKLVGSLKDWWDELFGSDPYVRPTWWSEPPPARDPELPPGSGRLRDFEFY